MRACVVKTERTQEESVACPFFRPDETISHTVLDYVCINGKRQLYLFYLSSLYNVIAGPQAHCFCITVHFKFDCTLDEPFLVYNSYAH